ncbi:MAG TPA: hypothetical protein VHG08_27220 [Longimicrobium sp.]|nr:hypothetical protein [Longimicrobium sp.]
MSPTLRRCALAAVLVPLVPVLAAAQEVSNRPAMSLSGGARLYESTDGASTAVSAAIRSELPIAEIFVLELAGSAADVPDDATSGIANLFESQLQLAIPLGEVLTPYAGAGAGIAQVKELGAMTEDWKAIFTAAVGMRVSLSSNLGAVVDARIRGRGSQIASHIDMSVGVRYQFGRPDRPRFRGGRQ